MCSMCFSCFPCIRRGREEGGNKEIKNKNRRLERWLSVPEDMLLFSRTQVQFLASMGGSSQPPVTPDPADIMHQKALGSRA